MKILFCLIALSLFAGCAESSVKNCDDSTADQNNCRQSRFDTPHGNRF